MDFTFTKKHTALLLAAIILFFIAVNTIALAVDRSPLHYDASEYYMVVWDFHQAPHSAKLLRVVPFEVSQYRPPMLFIFGDYFLYFSFLWNDPDFLALVSQLLYVLLLLGVFWTVRKLAPLESAAVALLAVLITAALPGVFGMSKQFMAAVPMAAMVWLALAAMLHSDYFYRPWPSLLFGVACGFGLMFKQTFLLFIPLPVALYLILTIRRRPPIMRLAKNLFLAALPLLLMAGPWYYKNFWQSYQINRQADSLPQSVGDLGFNPFYLERIVGDQVGWILMILAGLALARLLTIKSLRVKYGWLLLTFVAGFAPPFIYLSAASPMFARMSVPWLPLFAIVIALGFGAAGDKQNGRRRYGIHLGATALVVVFTLAQFLTLSFADANFTRANNRWLKPVYRVFPDLKKNAVNFSGKVLINREGVTDWFAAELLSLGSPPAPGQTLRVLLLEAKGLPPLDDHLATALARKNSRMIVYKLRYDPPSDDLLAAQEAIFNWPDRVVIHQPLHPPQNNQFQQMGLVISERWHSIFQGLNADGRYWVFKNPLPDAAAAPPTGVELIYPPTPDTPTP